MATVDETGRVAGATLHDVLRWLVRGGWPNTEANQRTALLAIDAHEQGYPDSAAWEEELEARAKKAAEQAPAPPDETQDERISRLERLVEAQQAQLEARANAAASSHPALEKAPKATT